jgi:hypothetical protein
MADTARALESSADFTRGGGAPAPDHDASEQTRSERVAEEQRRMRAVNLSITHKFQTSKIQKILKNQYTIDLICYEFKECKLNRLLMITVYPQTMDLISGLNLRLGLRILRMNV